MTSAQEFMASGWDQDDFKGKIKQYTSYTYKDKEERKNQTRKKTVVYNKAGQWISRTSWDGKNKRVSMTTYKYDKAGNLTTQTERDYVEEKTTNQDVTIDNDLRTITKTDRKTGEKTTTTYTEAGLEDQYIEVDKDGNHLKSAVLKRLESEKEYEFATLDRDKNKKITISVEWDDNGMQTKELVTFHQSRGNVEKIYTYLKIDKNNNWTLRSAEIFLLIGDQRRLMGKKITKRTITYFK